LKRAVFIIAFLLLAVPAFAETLGWNPVTQYTDGTQITGKTVYYQPVWSMTQNLASPKNMGGQITATMKDFTPVSEGMPATGWIYLSCKAIVDGMPSDLASPLAWDVARKKPVPPGQLKKIVR
jgi:hypothetical protein